MKSQGGLVSIFDVCSTGRAQQVRRTGGFDLDCDVDTAFPLFSPDGERAWVQDWDPKPVFPDQIAFSPDTVFREGTGAGEALWTVVDVDWPKHRAEYVRFAPASHSAHIIVKIEPAASGRSRVVVSYAVTVFGTDESSLLDAFSEDGYATKMQNWQHRITALLANR
jgi:hypothetical protein